MADQIGRMISEIIHMQNDQIENALTAGLIEGCGVRVERGVFDATKFSAKPDKNVPLGEIHEHVMEE